MVGYFVSGLIGFGFLGKPRAFVDDHAPGEGNTSRIKITAPDASADGDITRRRSGFLVN
jgi:hypothetical protein